MNKKEARQLGKQLAELVHEGNISGAYEMLAPVLSERTQFYKLDCIGEEVGGESMEGVNHLLDHIADGKTEGGWVVIASALREYLGYDLPGAFDLCRAYIIRADIWYGADIQGERVPGPALVRDFERALGKLKPWRVDPNRWVRRTIGVAVHFWAKRSHGEQPAQAERLLTFVEPLFGESEADAVKGVGWGLKTLGKYYPDLVTDWLAEQVVRRQRSYRALMLRKSLTYLTDEQRARATGGRIR
jgi:hypothetical protein